MSERPEGVGMSGAEPPMRPQPPQPPGPVSLETETAVRSGGISGIGARVAAGGLGLLLLVGGVAFAATQMGSDGGAADPESAVREMFDAIADEDVLGLLATLEPSERDVLSGPVEGLFEQLERLEVLDESFELTGIDGVDLEFEDLTFRQEPIRSDLQRVHLTGGTASFAVKTDDIPVGDFLADAFERFGVEYRGIEESTIETLDPAETGETFVVVRDTGDGWRVSLGYTAVEAMRLRSGAQVPVAGAGLAAVGADTPEEAVEGFLRAAVDIDVEGAVARLSPGELGAVHDYWPALVDEADLPTPDGLEVEIELTDVSLRSSTEGDRGRVFVDSIGVDVVTGDFRGGGTIVAGCVEVRGDVRTSMEDEGIALPEGPICRDDIEDILEEASGGQLGGSPFQFGGLGGLADLGVGEDGASQVGVAVVRIDGAWFVAPLATFADLGLAVLEGLEREDLDAMVDAAEELVGGFGGPLGGGFGPGDFEDLDGFEDLELDVEHRTERFEDSGEPLFGEGLREPTATDLDVVLEELLTRLTGDVRTARCVLGELYASAATEQLWELVDAYELQVEPSPETQDLVMAGLTACDGGG